MAIIFLHKFFFTEKKRLIYRQGQFSVSLFQYDTGVCVAELCNKVGSIIVLPFNGQMIWDAVFWEKSIKAKTMFEKPHQSLDFRDTYGCYLMHCGPRRIGFDEDNIHPLHGELPFANYESAWLTIGEDRRGQYIGISGEYRFDNEFSPRSGHYTAVPECRLYEDSSVLDIMMTIKNLSNDPMEFMYLFHVNNQAKPKGRFVQSCKCNSTNMRLLRPEPQDPMPEASIKLREGLIKDIEHNGTIMEDAEYAPEFTIMFSNLREDEEAYFHFMQIDSEGGADYTGIKKGEVIRYFERWWSRTKDRSVCSLASPSTCRTNGYRIQKEAGNVITVGGGESISMAIRIGYLQKAEAEKLEKKICDLI